MEWSNSDRASVIYELTSDQNSGQFCDILPVPFVCLKEPLGALRNQIPPQTPSYLALNSKLVNMPVVFPASLLSLWQGQLQISGKDEHVGKRNKQPHWG